MNANVAAMWQSNTRSPFAIDLLEGLKRRNKRIPSKYFYDTEGSLLFEQITELPEYYPTRAELEILTTRAGEIAALIGTDAALVEFGAGSLRKIRVLLESLPSLRRYVPIDIAGDYLEAVAVALKDEHPRLSVTPLAADFTRPVSLTTRNGRWTGFLPGSTLGNFAHREAVAVLSNIRHSLAGGGFLIGIDLVKSPAILHAAYNDSQGVTAAFNKNVLRRANRELQTNFNLGAFEHHACYNPFAQKIEMHLVSMMHQRVLVLGEMIEFAEGEAIHTEDSHKYTPDGFRSLAADAGYSIRGHWTDDSQLFAVFWLESR